MGYKVLIKRPDEPIGHMTWISGTLKNLQSHVNEKLTMQCFMRPYKRKPEKASGKQRTVERFLSRK